MPGERIVPFNNEAEQSVWVRAFIITERDGQKGIIVGKNGENIKKIRIPIEIIFDIFFPAFNLSNINIVPIIK